MNNRILGQVETEFFENVFGEEGSKKYFQGFRALRGEDVADSICYTASRPSHVNVANLTVVPLVQARVGNIHKEQ